MHEKLKDALVLFAEIAGLLAVFLLFLLILNYFKVIALPNLLPTQKPNTQNVSLLPSLTPSSTALSAITTKDSEGKINLYKTYTVPVSHYSAIDKNWMAGGVFAGYGKNTLMIISSNDTIVLSFNDKTIFEEVAINNSQGSSAATLGFIPYSDFNSFIKNASFGKYVQIYYIQDQSVSNQTAIKVDYLPSYKF